MMLTIIPRFLRDPKTFFQEVRAGREVRRKILALAVSTLLFLATYGFMTGLAHSWIQALSSAVKMPLLFMATGAFCLPSLYFFSLALLRTQLDAGRVTVVVLAGAGVTAFLLLGLSPITFFFVLTSDNYPFFQLLAVIFVAVSGCIGLYFLWMGMTWVDWEEERGQNRMGRGLLAAWLLLYAFVASQMTWRLSPLIGDPRQPFVWLRPSRDNFYVDVIHAVEQLWGNSGLVWSWPGALETILLGGMCLVPIALLIFGLGLLAGGRKRGSSPTRESAHNASETPQVAPDTKDNDKED
jgi:hypothetical protein